MLNVRLSDRPMISAPEILVLPVAPDGESNAVLLPVVSDIDDELRAEIQAFLADAEHSGKAGAIASLPRPLRTPRRVLFVGVGKIAGEAGWRAAGAAVARAAGSDRALAIAMPTAASAVEAAENARAVAEGLWLASYRFRLPEGRKPSTGAVVDISPDEKLQQVTLLVDDSDALADTITDASTIATATRFARDLTNMPSDEKSPEWFANQISAVAAGNPRLRVRVRAGAELADFGGITAVGGGSTRHPRLVELSWEPENATQHVVLVGKGITFDTGGISIKPASGMLLMRKDMGGAAAIMAATLGAAEMNLPIRITALAPLAENSVGGNSYRPGDVVRHYGGLTSEILNTDAEGRLVLADALAYASEQLEPDYLIDLATLTGANLVSLGRRAGALFTEDDALAAALTTAAADAGEAVWRMPLTEDYMSQLRSDVADLAHWAAGGAGATVAALFLREFTGTARARWAHIDMSAPSWAPSADGELAKGATGWGVRTLLRWLETLTA